MTLNSKSKSISVPAPKEPPPIEILHESLDSTIAIEINKLQRQIEVMRAARLLNRFKHIIQEAEDMLKIMEEKNQRNNRDLINKQKVAPETNDYSTPN